MRFYMFSLYFYYPLITLEIILGLLKFRHHLELFIIIFFSSWAIKHTVRFITNYAFEILINITKTLTLPKSVTTSVYLLQKMTHGLKFCAQQPRLSHTFYSRISLIGYNLDTVITTFLPLPLEKFNLEHSLISKYYTHLLSSLMNIECCTNCFSVNFIFLKYSKRYNIKQLIK